MVLGEGWTWVFGASKFSRFSFCASGFCFDMFSNLRLFKETFFQPVTLVISYFQKSFNYRIDFGRKIKVDKMTSNWLCRVFFSSRCRRWLKLPRKGSDRRVCCQILWTSLGSSMRTSVMLPWLRLLQLMHTPRTARTWSLVRRASTAFVSFDWLIFWCSSCACLSCVFWSAASVSRIAKYLYNDGLNIITAGAYSFDFEQKKTDCDDEFHMLTRVGTLSFESIAEFTANLMRTFSWRRAAFVYERNGYYQAGGLQTCHL